MSEGGVKKRRRIIIDDDEDEEGDVNDNLSHDSNPDNDLGNDPDDEDDGINLEETWRADYGEAPELDHYDADDLDDSDMLPESYEQMMADRIKAENALDEADLYRRRQQHFDDYLGRETTRDAKDLELEEDEDDWQDGQDEDRAVLNLEAFECPLREWIAEERTRREIQRRFKKFLDTYYCGIEEVTRYVKKFQGLAGSEKIQLPDHLKVSPPVYSAKIRAMCAANSSSLEVSYGHLAEMQSLLAIWLTDVPKDMLQIFDEVLYNSLANEFPHYSENIVKDVHVRIIGLPISDKLRDLRQGDLNNLIRVVGVVTRRTGIFPLLKATAYDCTSCGATLGPYRDLGLGATAVMPGSCPSCDCRVLRINPQLTEYGNYQRLTLQETPGSVPPGRVPRYKEVVLVGDLIDIARPGDEIEVTGIFVHNQLGISRERNGFPVFSTVIEANCVRKMNTASNSDLSDEDKRRMRELARDPQIGERIIRSIAPSIYGHRHIKTAVALSLFGGCPKEGGSEGTHRVRGDINILLLGDPGTAKSQILKYAEKIAPRAVYSTGKGASAVGLTAGVHKDPLTREWTLEGGALVLADRGVCLIDEFDKMNEQDRTSIHEAMEQQTISVSKAGIVCSLQARCAVMAAANPIGGRYDPSFTFSENVELTDPILQRFDVLCVLQDVVDPVVDEKLATFVVESHARSHPDAHLGHLEFMQDDDDNDDNNDDEDNDNDGEGSGESRIRNALYSHDASEEGKTADLTGEGDDSASGAQAPQEIDQATLKKYITYARLVVKPVLHNVDTEKVAALYAELRKQSSISGGIPIAVRHIESIMRLSEASARMHLRDQVRDDDVDLAIKVILESFLQAQKVSVRKVLQNSFRKYITFGEENNHLLMHQLQGLIVNVEKYKQLRGLKADEKTVVYMHELENKAKEMQIFDLRPFYASSLFRNYGMSIDTANHLIIKSYAC